MQMPEYLLGLKKKIFLMLLVVFISNANGVMAQTEVRIRYKDDAFVTAERSSLELVSSQTKLSYIALGTTTTTTVDTSLIAVIWVNNQKKTINEYFNIKIPVNGEHKEKNKNSEETGKVTQTEKDSTQSNFLPDSDMPPKGRSKSSLIGVYLNIGKVVGEAAAEKALDFRLDYVFGGTIQFQHFFRGSSFGIFIQPGVDIFLQKGGTSGSRRLMRSFMLQAGLKYYVKDFYGFLEGGIYLTQRDSSNSRYDQHTSISFAPGVGYEIKLGKKSFVDLNLRYQFIPYQFKSNTISSHLLNQKQLIGFPGLRAGYNFIL